MSNAIVKSNNLHKPFASWAILVTASALFAAVLTAAPAFSSPKAASAPALANTGPVDMYSDQNIITKTAITYIGHVHMRTQSGATMTCDKLVGDLNPAGGGFKDCVATGNVVAHVVMVKDQTYDISADQAYYDIAANQIDLTGKEVKAVALTPYTKGPLIQTGDSGVVILGPSPNYPDITLYPTILMKNVHTQFTPASQSGSATHADTREKSGQGV